MNRPLVPGWQELSVAGRLGAFQSAYWFFALIPPLTHLLDYFSISYLPLNLGAFYLSACFFMVATTTYVIFCPRIVKFRDYNLFVAEGRGIESLLEVTSESAALMHPDNVEYMLVRFFVDVERQQPTIDGLRGGRLSLRPQESQPALFWTLRNFVDRSRRWPRAVAAGCYALGFTLIVFVALRNFVYVWSYAHLGELQTWFGRTRMF